MSEEQKEKGEAKIVSPKERTATITLDWPVEFDGKVYEALTIRRITGTEVELFMRKVAALEEDDLSLVPPGLECPEQVWRAVDDDDRVRIEQAMLPFLPRRLLLAGGLIQETSDSSSAE